MSDITLNEIAAISGKPGLFRIISPSRQGVVVESLDEKRRKMAVSTRNQVSVLGDIQIYALNQEGTVALSDVLYKMHEEFGDDPGVTAKDSPEEHFALLKHVLPEYDENRVFPSDVRKMISWYHLLLKQAPGALQAPAEQGAEPDEDQKKKIAEERPEAKEAKADKAVEKKARPAAKSTKKQSEDKTTDDK